MSLSYRNVRNGNVVSVREPDEVAADEDDEHRGKHLATHQRRTIARMDASNKWERATDDNSSKKGNRGRSGRAEPLVDRVNNPDTISQPVVLEDTKGSPDAVPGTTTKDADGNLPSGHLAPGDASDDDYDDDYDDDDGGDGGDDEETADADSGSADEVDRPSQGDTKADWVDYAVAAHDYDRSEAESMTKNDLIELE